MYNEMGLTWAEAAVARDREMMPRAIAFFMWNLLVRCWRSLQWCRDMPPEHAFALQGMPLVRGCTAYVWLISREPYIKIH